MATGEVLVCEGYTDVIGFFTAGIPRAVATCGTALAEEHFKLLRNFAKRIVLAYDADSAGQSATSRVYEWERRHEVDVAVAALPPGTDPGELARTDPEALREAVAGARPFLQFRVDRVFDGADLSSAEGRARAADAALGAVAEHPDDLVRDQYVMQISDRCRLEPDPGPRAPRGGPPATGTGARARGPTGRHRAAVRGPSASRRARARANPNPGPTTPRARPGGPASARGDGTSRPGLEALRFAVHRPEDVADRLEDVLFVDDVQRRAFVALAGADDLGQAVQDSPPEVAALLRRISVEEPIISEDPLADPADAVVTQLVREASRRALADLGVQARTSGGDLGDIDAQTGRVRRWLEELEDPDAGRDAADRLLAWLMAKGQEG